MDGLVMGGGDYPCGFMVGDSGRDGFSWRSMELGYLVIIGLSS